MIVPPLRTAFRVSLPNPPQLVFSAPCRPPRVPSRERAPVWPPRPPHAAPAEARRAPLGQPAAGLLPLHGPLLLPDCVGRPGQGAATRAVSTSSGEHWVGPHLLAGLLFRSTAVAAGCAAVARTHCPPHMRRHACYPVRTCTILPPLRMPSPPPHAPVDAHLHISWTRTHTHCSLSCSLFECLCSNLWGCSRTGAAPGGQAPSSPRNLQPSQSLPSSPCAPGDPRFPSVFLSHALQHTLVRLLSGSRQLPQRALR